MEEAREKKELYEMAFHQTKKFSTGFYVTRVPGGWIYEDAETSSAVFVPYHNEFQEVDAK